MFKIIEFQSTTDGKTRITIETDEFSSALMLRFFSEADKFAQIYHYRLKTEARVEASQKSGFEKMAQLKKTRAQLLKTFREISGTYAQRLKILQEIRKIEGEEITQDRLSARIKIAKEEDKEGKIFSIKRLIKKGNTIDEIASALDIPKSTASRYLRSVRGGKAIAGPREAIGPGACRFPPGAVFDGGATLYPPLFEISRLIGLSPPFRICPPKVAVRGAASGGHSLFFAFYIFALADSNCLSQSAEIKYVFCHEPPMRFFSGYAYEWYVKYRGLFGPPPASRRPPRAST